MCDPGCGANRERDDDDDDMMMMVMVIIMVQLHSDKDVSTVRFFKTSVPDDTQRGVGGGG